MSKPKGDGIAPAQEQSAARLNAPVALVATDGSARATGPRPAASIATSMASCDLSTAPRTTCLQTVWVTFFFDGTGNNHDADIGTLEHSNVARLFRVHAKDDKQRGIYRRYIPGLGTYFPDISDAGGTLTGQGFGARGQDRLDWAFKQLTELLKPHQARAHNPSNRIVEVNIAVFGFSRGATLARAFVRDLYGLHAVQSGGRWCLRNGQHPLRVRFMGLWDTVASVGLPMSTNNTPAAYSAGLESLSFVMRTRGSQGTAATDLAFGAPGADPAPGDIDGHGSWANDLAIHPAVEQAVHFIAAHEVRNSFPVDSVCRGQVKPANCKEMVYPGVHSDVGGGYRPGEGGKSAGRDEQLSLIPLRAMYDEALASGVPLMAETAWQTFNKEDFATSAVLRDRYNHYMSTAGWGGKPLGDMMNAHMALYYAWRFRSIRRKQQGDTAETQRIGTQEQQFRTSNKALEQELAAARRREAEASRRLGYAQQRRSYFVQSQYGNARILEALKPYDAEVAQAQAEHALARDALLRAQARVDTAPAVGKLQGNLAVYDAQLLQDAQALHNICTRTPARRHHLRPHYRGLLAAYENEFIHGRGLTDQKIIDFFEHHVHDSLAGFAKDATLPSDPRVIYIGGDVKSRHAAVDRSREGEALPA